MVGFVYVILKTKAYSPIRSLGYKSLYLAGAIIFVNTTKVLTGLWRKNNSLNSRNTKKQTRTKNTSKWDQEKSCLQTSEWSQPNTTGPKKNYFKLLTRTQNEKKKKKASRHLIDARPGTPRITCQAIPIKADTVAIREHLIMSAICTTKRKKTTVKTVQTIT